MKKFVLLFAVLCCLMGVGVGQTAYTSIIMSTQLHGMQFTTVRSWNSQYSVCGFSDTLGAGLCVVDHTDFYSTPTPSGPNIPAHIARITYDTNRLVFISDVFVYNNYAVFCGTYKEFTSKNITEGIIGYINLNAILSGTPVFTIYRISQVDKLNKIVAYPDNGGGLKAVAIGSKVMSGGSFSRDVVVEFKKLTAGGTLYDCVNLDAGIIKKDAVYDVLQIANTVVLVGHYVDPLGSPSDVLSFRTANAQNVASDLFNNHTLHYLQTTSGPEVNATTTATLMSLSSFAVAYTHANSSNNTFSTRLRVIDFSNLSNTYSQEIVRNEKDDPIMITYIPQSQIVEMAQYGGKDVEFLRWYPYNIFSYSVQRITTAYTGNTSHVRNLFTDNFIAISQNYVYLQNPLIVPPSLYWTCIMSHGISETRIPNLTVNSVSSNVSTNPSPFLTFPYQSTYEYSIFNINCYYQN